MKEDTVREDILSVFVLFAVFGFLTGQVVEILAWIIHGLFTGFFRPSIALLVDFGILYAVLGLVLAVLFVGLTYLTTRPAFNGMIYVGLFLALAGAIWLAIEYEKILALMDAFDDEYPYVGYALNLIILPIGVYVAGKQYQKGKKREAIILCIFFGLCLAITIMAILTN